MAEVLVPTLPLPVKQSYLELLVTAGHIRLLPITRETLIEAAGLLGSSSMKLPDRIHVATAATSAAGAFVTRDKTIRVPAGMAVLGQNEPDLLQRLGLA